MESMKIAWIGGINGFIGHHMARRLKSQGYYVRGVDIKEYEYGPNDYADEVVIGDLRDPAIVNSSLRFQGKYSYHIKAWDLIQLPDLIMNFACQMGGAQYIFTGENDADIMHDSALINLHIGNWCKQNEFKGKLFYSSSACIYPQGIQENTFNPGLKESSAWPADPDSCYGVEKLFSEKLYDSYHRNNGIDIRIARFHNIYGPEGTYKNGREKAPAAMCRKAAEAKDTEGIGCRNFVEVFGDGMQTRSFLFIDDCIDAVCLLLESDFHDPINIGSEEMVSINDLAHIAIDLSGKKLMVNNVHSDALGVRGRNSDNTLARIVLKGWEPKYSLKDGMTILYSWVNKQVNGK